MQSKRFFITGGAGFIGANLAKYLLGKSECFITVYDNLSTGSIENLNKAIEESIIKANVNFIKGDILDPSHLSKSLNGHDAVVHLAAHTRVVESLKSPKENFYVNSLGTFNILESCRKRNIDKLIFASSNAAVGEQIPPINEEIIPKPISPYGATKLVGEALCSAYFRSYKIKTASLRFANVYGPYSEHKTSVISKFLKRAKEGKSLEIYGDGHQTRDFIHAFDICQAIYSFLGPQDLETRCWGEVFQIATGIETKIIDLARMIKDLVVSSSLKHIEIILKEERTGEIKQNFSEIDKARRLLDFEPTIILKQGIKNLWLSSQ